MNKFPVRIAGGSLAGLTTAIQLARHGVSVEVFERRLDSGAAHPARYDAIENWTTRDDFSAVVILFRRLRRSIDDVVDLSNYICPAGQPYPVVGVHGSSGYEICQSQRNPDGYCYFVKNQHSETIWFDKDNIYRGLDTSGVDQDDAYAQFTNGRYGAVWAKRNMSVGQIVQRSPDIQRYHANGQKKGDLATHIVSYLVFVRYYDKHKFSTGVVIQNLVELHWTSDAAGLTVLERYFYAFGRGLVGFYASAPGGYQSEIGALSASPAPVRAPFPFTEPLPPPIEVPNVPPPANKSGPTCGRLALTGVRLRTRPTLSGNIIREMLLGETVTYYQKPVTSADGYQWVWVETQNGNGYSARTIGGQSTFGAC